MWLQNSNVIVKCNEKKTLGMCFNYCYKRDKSAFICAGNHLFNCARV